MLVDRSWVGKDPSRGWSENGGQSFRVDAAECLTQITIRIYSSRLTKTESCLDYYTHYWTDLVPNGCLDMDDISR